MFLIKLIQENQPHKELTGIKGREIGKTADFL